MKNIKIYTAAGETILLDNVNWNKIKSQVVSKNYDGSYYDFSGLPHCLFFKITTLN